MSTVVDVDREIWTWGQSMWFLMLLVLVVAGIVAFRYRVPLLSKVLGQPESRVRRALEQRRNRH